MNKKERIKKLRENCTIHGDGVARMRPEALKRILMENTVILKRIKSTMDKKKNVIPQIEIE